MILGEKVGGEGPTLDDLFRRMGVRHPEALALADPPNRLTFCDGAPRRLTFAQADRAISAMAARLHGLGLAVDSVVAVQLGNTVENVIALLGVLRAGMIAAPLPLLWRQRDIVAALSSTGAKAIITAGRIGGAEYAAIGMQAAVELFPIRYVCAFGADLPDGIVPLDDIFGAASTEFARSPRTEQAAAHLAVITFETTREGFMPVPRNSVQLIAGGLAVTLEAAIADDTAILSTIPPSSFAGIALTVLPWLIGGGALHLHHGFEATTFKSQSEAIESYAAVLPGPALAPLDAAGLLDAAKSIVALWRAPERMATAPIWQGAAAFTDVANFGETGLVAMQRDANGVAAKLPCGVVKTPRDAAGLSVVETMRGEAGTLALRGAMVPVSAFPPSAESPVDETGFVDTGLLCRRDGDTLKVSGPPAGTIGVGGYRFDGPGLEVLVAEVDPAATLLALPDALTGIRLAGGANDAAGVRAALDARGVNPLVSGAFRERKRPKAA